MKQPKKARGTKLNTNPVRRIDFRFDFLLNLVLAANNSKNSKPSWLAIWIYNQKNSIDVIILTVTWPICLPRQVIIKLVLVVFKAWQ